MKKKTTKIKKNSFVSPGKLAEAYKSLYDAFVNKGFTTDQAFDLVLVILSRTQ